MGILSFLGRKKPADEKTLEIPVGTVTVDKNGDVVSSTLPASFPRSGIDAFSKPILTIFQSARDAQLSITEIVISYSALKITAKEMRGGAMIFLTPHGPKKQD